MRPMEIVYGSLAEAREHGPGDVLVLAREQGLRLLSSPSYCERDGRGVCAFDVAGEPLSEPREGAYVDAIRSAQPDNDSPAAAVAAQPEIDQ